VNPPKPEEAHEWALNNGFEWDEDNGYYYSKLMPPVDTDTILGIYTLLTQKSVEARIKQTRKIHQHEKDVFGTSRNESYFDAEIAHLESSLKPNERTEE
jgi:hypothetical protein